MPILQSQFGSLLLPGIYKHFDLNMEQTPQRRLDLFNVQDSNLYQERGQGVAGLSVNAWDVYPQSGQPGEITFKQLWEQTYDHVEYVVRFHIEKKLTLNDQYGVMRRRMNTFAMSAIAKMETDAATILNNAFTDTGPDGAELCATDHPGSPDDSSAGNQQSNEGTSTLSEASVSATRTGMMQFHDGEGEFIGVMPDELWVPPELEDRARKIVGSTLEPESGNNAINAQLGRFRVIPWLRLTDTNAWFMVDSRLRRQMVNWYNREPFQVMLYDETTTMLTYEAKLHYSYGYDSWQWIYGHNPS